LHPELPREASQQRYNDAKEPLAVTAGEYGISSTPGVVAPIDDYRTVMAQRAIFQATASMGRFSYFIFISPLSISKRPTN
jgi:fission process protein 1